jgi:hypothetical protein
VLAPELSGQSDFRERRLAESQLVPSLDHPNVRSGSVQEIQP